MPREKVDVRAVTAKGDQLWLICTRCRHRLKVRPDQLVEECLQEMRETCPRQEDNWYEVYN